MRSRENRDLFITIRRILGWILRPRLSYLRLREIHHARTARPVRDDIALDNVPTVTLIPADNEDRLKEVVRVYTRHPSRLLIAPRKDAAIKELVAKGYEYYLVANESGLVVGAVGWHSCRAMVCHKVIDYRHRSRGYGIATSLALFSLLAKRGYRKCYSQVFKDNRRNISGLLSLGYKIDGEDPEGLYFLLSRDLIPPEEV